jgi:hypothetical protein
MIVDECGCFTPNYMIVLAFYVHTHTHTNPKFARFAA